MSGFVGLGFLGSSGFVAVTTFLFDKLRATCTIEWAASSTEPKTGTQPQPYLEVHAYL